MQKDFRKNKIRNEVDAENENNFSLKIGKKEIQLFLVFSLGLLIIICAFFYRSYCMEKIMIGPEADFSDSIKEKPCLL